MDQPDPDTAHSRWLHRLTILAWLMAAACLGALVGLSIMLTPDRYKPWTPLTLDVPSGPLVETKLAQLRGDFDACLTTLESGTLGFSIAEARDGAGACGWEEAIVIEEASAPFSAPQPVVTRCALAAAFNLWERETLLPAAERHFGEPVTEILHYGTYSCRPVNGREGARLSEHSYANAIDIAGVRLNGGRVVRVQSGWNGEADERAFLRELHEGGCDVFRGVIGPDGDSRHLDHFHFDMGPWDFCR